MTHAQRNAKVLAAVVAHHKKAMADKEYARRTLIESGIYTEDGQLSPAYGGPKIKAKAKV